MSSNLRYLSPKPGVQLKVIGAGLPRTGTNSFCAAISYLLDGPAYHVGVQTVLSENDEDVRDWIHISRNWLDGSPSSRNEVIKTLKRRLNGYVAATDPPASLLVPELMAAFPDAIVICTVRDPEKWADSMALLVRISKPQLSRFLFALVPVVRWSPTLWNLFTPMWKKVYDVHVTSRETALVARERHHAWLESIVPPEKLFYADVKDGWEPLCRALNVPVPKDVPFPRLNDSKDIEAVFTQLAVRGLIRWAILLGALLATFGLVWMFTRG